MLYLRYSSHRQQNLVNTIHISTYRRNVVALRQIHSISSIKYADQIEGILKFFGYLPQTQQHAPVYQLFIRVIPNSMEVCRVLRRYRINNYISLLEFMWSLPGKPIQPIKKKSFFQDSSVSKAYYTTSKLPDSSRYRDIPTLNLTFAQTANAQGYKATPTKEDHMKYGQHSDRKRFSDYVTSSGGPEVKGFSTVQELIRKQRPSYHVSNLTAKTQATNQSIKDLDRLDKNPYSRITSPRSVQQPLQIPTSPRSSKSQKQTIQHIEDYRQLLSPRQIKKNAEPILMKSFSNRDSSYTSTSSRNEEAKQNCTNNQQRMESPNTKNNRVFRKDPDKEKRVYNSPREQIVSDEEFNQEGKLKNAQYSGKLFSTKYSYKKLEESKNANSLEYYIRQKITPAPDPQPSNQLALRGRQASRESLSIRDFQMGRCKGDGKFGKVFPCLNTKTGTIYAIKQIPKQVLVRSKMENQFTWQVKIQSFFDHPNIVKLYSFFSDANNIYLLMEYMEGGTLFDYLKKQKGGKLPQEEASKRMREVCSAVHYMHDLQVAHRDIKPQNIVLSNGVAKLCDFGWSTLTHERRTTYCGTFDYSSPQMLQGKQYDESIDLWSLGVLAYELLTGKLPFYSASRKQTINNIVSVDQKQISFPSDMSWQAKSFIEGLLKKQPDERKQAQMLLKHPFLIKYNKDRVL